MIKLVRKLAEFLCKLSAVFFLVGTVFVPYSMNIWKLTNETGPISEWAAVEALRFAGVFVIPLGWIMGWL